MKQPGGTFRIDCDEFIPEKKKLADFAHKYNAHKLLDLAHRGLFSPGLPILAQALIKVY